MNPEKKCNILKKLFLPALLAFELTATGQEPKGSKISFNHLTVENGLSQSSILSIAQDSTGFMWFGTKDGLNKFNSQNFEVFKHDKNNPASLSSSKNINTLLTDRKGNLWIGTQNGLNLFLPKSNSFRRFQHNPNDKSSISNDIIRHLFQDKAGHIWIGTENGLNKMLKNGKFQRFYSGKEGIAGNLVKAIHQDHQGVLWIGTQRGLSSMRSENGGYIFKSYFHQTNNPKSLAEDDINTIFEDVDHHLWIGTHNSGIDLYDRDKSVFKHFTSKKKTTECSGQQCDP